MAERHAVISGASIAGLSAAFWLRRTGWRVTVLERAEAFRDGGRTSTSAASPARCSPGWG